MLNQGSGIGESFVCKYVDENSMTVMLDAKRSAGVASEVDLRNSLPPGDEVHKAPWL